MTYQDFILSSFRHVVIPVEAGIQKYMLDAGSGPA